MSQKKARAARASKKKAPKPLYRFNEHELATFKPRILELNAIERQYAEKARDVGNAIKLVYPKWAPGMTASIVEDIPDRPPGIYREADLRPTPPSDDNARPVRALRKSEEPVSVKPPRQK